MSTLHRLLPGYAFGRCTTPPAAARSSSSARRRDAATPRSESSVPAQSAQPESDNSAILGYN